MKSKRILALIFALMLVLSAVPALAAEEVEVSLTDANSEIGVAKILLSVTNNSAADLTFDSIVCTSASNGNLVGAEFKRPLNAGVEVDFIIGTNQTNSIILTASSLSSSVTGTVTATFTVLFVGGITKNVTTVFDFGTPTTSTPDPNGTAQAAFRMSAYDRAGKLVATPSGDAGDTIKIRVPLLCLHGPVNNISVAPKVSTNIDEFPFVISQMDYTLYRGGGAETGETIEFEYNLKLAKKVTSGVKKVDFIVSYTNWNDWSNGNNTIQTMTVSVYVNIINGYTEATPGDKPVVSQPKLILESYSFSADKIYAGEEFSLNFTLKNTSTVEAVQNIQISIADTADTGKLLPAENGSNTIYIPRIEKGEAYTVTYKMQSAADIDPKAYKLGLSLAYEGAKNVVAYTATDTISVTLLQKVRLKFDTPVFYDEFYVGSTCGTYLAMYNMGRSSVYNCMVTVEGDGLQMEETYFGGTVAAGSTMSADFNIISNTPGQIEGFIVVTYEDSLGEQMEERIPISIYVNDMGGTDGGIIDPGFEEPGIYEPGIDTGAGVSGGLPLWAWIVIGVGVLGCAAAVLLVLRKKRSKQLEDV